MTPQPEPQELITEYTPSGHPTNRTHLRSHIHKHAIPHLVIHIWLCDNTGHVLCQQRALSKRANPGKWDLSVGGHICAGEGIIESAIRECHEEIGVEFAEDDGSEQHGGEETARDNEKDREDKEEQYSWSGALQLRFQTHRIMKIDLEFTENEFIEVFVLLVPRRPVITRQQSEVNDTKWVHWEALKQEYEKNDGEWVPLNEEYFDKLFAFFEDRFGEE